MRLIWREVSGGFQVREITLKRDVSVSSPFPLLGLRGGLTWLVGGEQLACASRRVEAERAAWQRGGQGDTEGKDECAGSWALRQPSCCLGCCLGRSHWVKK